MRNSFQLTENFSGVQGFEPLGTSNKFITCETTVRVLKGEQHIYGIAHPLLGDELRGVADE